MKLTIAVFFTILLGVAAAQRSSSDKASVELTFPNTQHDGVKASNICQVDFRNIRLIRNARQTVQLNGGNYKQRSKTSGFGSVRINEATCFDGEKGSQLALVSSIWSLGHGNSNRECVVQVFALHSGHPVVTQQFDFDCSAFGTGASFNPNNRRLSIHARTKDGSPHYGAKTLDVVHYAWNTERFEQKSFQRIPDGLEEH